VRTRKRIPKKPNQNPQKPPPVRKFSEWNSELRIALTAARPSPTSLRLGPSGTGRRPWGFLGEGKDGGARQAEVL